MNILGFLSGVGPGAGASGLDTTAWVGLGLLLAGGGAVCLVVGWRIYRVLLVAFGTLAAGALAASLTSDFGTLVMLGLGVPVGAFGGLLAARIERFGVFVLGGLAGAVPILVNADFFLSNHTMYFAALICFLLAGSLAVLFWKPAIVLSMCIVGATLVERGVMILLEAAQPGLALRVSSEHNLAVTLVFLALLLVGLVTQMWERRLAEKG